MTSTPAEMTSTPAEIVSAPAEMTSTITEMTSPPKDTNRPPLKASPKANFSGGLRVEGLPVDGKRIRDASIYMSKKYRSSFYS